MAIQTNRIRNRAQYESALARLYELSSSDELTDQAGVELQSLSRLVEVFEDAEQGQPDRMDLWHL